jgi:hypothetical protein
MNPGLSPWSSFDATGRASLTRRDRAIARVEAQKVTRLVELAGIEPATPWLQTRCSPS